MVTVPLTSASSSTPSTYGQSVSLTATITTPTCTLAPAAVQVSGATANSTLSVLTTLPHLTQARNSASLFLPNFRWGSGILLACLFCTLRPRFRSSWRLLIAIFGATTFLCVLAGFAGKTTPPVGTTQGSYNITISASSNPTVASPAPVVVSLTIN